MIAQQAYKNNEIRDTAHISTFAVGSTTSRKKKIM